MSKYILIVGGADTGRAPMAAGLLRRISAAQGKRWNIESAGVLGHDEDPPEPEARSAMVALGIDISEHRARSLSDELAVEADVLLAIDSGTARVLLSRYPAAAGKIVSLGELAGRKRDIPDPFRMQVGVWITYAREIESLLQQGLNQLIARVEGGGPPPVAPLGPAAVMAPPPAPPPPAAPPAPPAARTQSLALAQRLLGMLADMPDVIAWEAAQTQLLNHLTVIGGQPCSGADLVLAYTNMLSALLSNAAQRPTPQQVALLREAFAPLEHEIDAGKLSHLAGLIGRWGVLM